MSGAQYYEVDDNGNKKPKSSSSSSALTMIFFILFIASAGAGSFYAYKYYKGPKDSNGSNGKVTPTPSPSSTADWAQLFQSMAQNINPKIDPCQDFYEYSCGTWKANNPLKPSESSNTRSFSTIGDSNTDALKEIAEQDWPIIGPMYRSCMDVDGIDNIGIGPVQAVLPNVYIPFATVSQAVQAAGSLLTVGVQPFFSVLNAVNPNIPTQMLLDIGQGGLGLPAAEYYEDGNLTALYQTHVENMMMLWTGNNTVISQAAAKAVVDFETKISKFTKPPAEMRDPNALNNAVDLNGLLNFTGNVFDWNSFLNKALISNYTSLTFNADNPKFLSSMNDLIASTSVTDLTYYIFWQGLHGLSGLLPSNFRKETFNFYSGVLGGVTEPQERWKTCVGVLDSTLGDILGRYYVLAKFGGDSKTKAFTMIKNIMTAFNENLPSVSWMDDATREKAGVKLSEITVQVGYPAVWRTYSKAVINANTFSSNVLSATELSWTRNVERLSQPATAKLWQMTPPTVNAYYDPTYNSINIPAGIVQPPMFSADYPDAVNYGGIGFVEGHELTHGFDDQGAQYDGHGKLSNWWSQASLAEFKKRTSCLVNQYEKFEVDGRKVNGTLTLGENIADNGGIQMAFKAFKALQKANGTQSLGDTSNLPVGLTSWERVFFSSAAQGWCTNMRPKAAQARLISDPHSPAFARVNGPLANFEEFGKAFGCKRGDPMFPAEKDVCTVW